MAVPKMTLWEREPHTAGKHLVLESYLKAWFPIMARRNPRILFIDGFAGPGEYLGGEEGSPTIAMRAWADHVARPRIESEVIFVFIEERADRVRHLEGLVARWDPKLPETAKVHVWPGTFESLMTEALDQLDEQHARMAPALVMMDPFGVKGIPIDVIKRILGNEEFERSDATIYYAGQVRSHALRPMERAGRIEVKVNDRIRKKGSTYPKTCRINFRPEAPRFL